MKHPPIVLWLAVLLGFFATGKADSLETGFAHPPANGRPWVYWFWNNANVTSNGITADLEAMQRVGVGGVLIMDVLERFAPPRGTAEFMNPEWQHLFQFSVQEAARLGLEINMNNGPGWTGSSGPWITPALSMQRLVWTNLTLTGPTNFSAVLPRPDLSGRHHDSFDSQIKFDDYYADIGVLAIPVKTNGEVSIDEVVNLTAKLQPDGKLSWSVPPGKWVLQRIGHTPTGSSTRPPVAGGNGLECDKLSRAALDAHFAGMMGKLIQTAGPLAGKSLVATHIDSWEVGTQNWTPLLRSEFKKRRGYDPLPWLPSLTESDSSKLNFDPAQAARFRWDFDQTIAELLAENYSGHMAELAHQHGMRYSVEGYNLPFGDEFTYTARADEPMSEFWTATGYGQNETWQKAREMASVAHVYGHAVVGAEAFTSGDQELWKLTPRDIKALGDYEFSQGINRFVIHRYAHQPYLDRAPGATMGPWGLHYERTQTWWEMAGAWHAYLARCQFMLRQGKFVADLLYLRPQQPNQTYFTPNPPVPAGYRYDEISAEALLRRVYVKNRRLGLPDGMSYRVLVLPDEKTMTPELLAKIHELVQSGATVIANAAAPAASPSRQHFPACDQTVARLGREIWGKCDGANITEHRLGKGRLIWGQPVDMVLKRDGIQPDFISDAKLNWIHRHADGAEVYFVANPSDVAVQSLCAFRVKNLRPEIWNPDSGRISKLAVYQPTSEGITIPLRLEPSGSAFIVFRKSASGCDPVVKFLRNGQPLPAPLPPPDTITIQSAIYGVPGDLKRSRDVRSQVQTMVDAGETMFQVAELARQGDPAYGIVKTLTVEYLLGDQNRKAQGQDPDTVALRPVTSAPESPAELVCDALGKSRLLAREPGHYEWITASGKTNREDIESVAAPVELAGPWRLNFPPHWGAPASITLTNLMDWINCADDGVKHFSGTATYVKTFDLPAESLKAFGQNVCLDLGRVEVMAQVKLNGQNLGIAWKPPYRVEVGSALHAGPNVLEVEVANLWPNRMIGDAALPVGKRFTWSSFEPFNPSTPLLSSGLLGPVQLVPGE